MTAPNHEMAPMGANPGETLRQARESKGWSLASVAQQLNLTARSVAQIEAGDFSQLPGIPSPVDTSEPTPSSWNWTLTGSFRNSISILAPAPLAVMSPA